MKEELTTDLRDIWHIIRKRWRMIALITILCTAASGALSFYVLKPVYESETSIIVSKPKSDTGTQTYNDVLMYQNLVKTYSEIAKSRLVATRAAEKLDNKYTSKQIQLALSVTPQASTQIIVLTVDNGNAQEAVKIINAVTDSFIEVGKEVYPTGGDVHVLDSAQYPSVPVKPNKILNILVAFVMGMMLSTGLCFLLEHLDKTIKSDTDVTKYLELPVIGIIPKES